MKKLSAVFITIALFLVGNLALADVSVTNRERISLGNKTGVMCDIGFDNSYNYGGEFSGATMFGLTRVQEILFYNQDGYAYQYDAGTKRIKVLAQAPPIVYEERHADSASSGNTSFLLDYPAAYIMSIVKGGITPFPLAISGVTSSSLTGHWAALSSPIQDDMRTGITISQTDGVSGASFYVTYVTQAWKDVYNLLVQNQTVHLQGSKINNTETGSGNTIFAWQCGKFANETTGVTPYDWADGTGGAGSLGGAINIDFGESGTSGSQVGYSPTDEGKDLIISYLKYPPANSWLRNHWISNEDAATGTSAMMLDKPLLMWNLSGWGTSSGDSPWQIGYSGYPLAPDGSNRWYDANHHFPASGQIAAFSGVSIMTTQWGVISGVSSIMAPFYQATNAPQTWGVYENNGRAMTHASYVWGWPWEIPNVRKLQVLNGSDLSGITTRALVIGY